MKDSTKHNEIQHTQETTHLHVGPITKATTNSFSPIMKTAQFILQHSVVIFLCCLLFSHKHLATIPLVIPLLRRDFFIKRPTFEWQVPDTQGTATLSLEDNTWGQSVVGNRKNKLGLSRGFR